MMTSDLFGTEPALATLATDGSVAIVLSSNGERVLGGTDMGQRAFGIESGAVPRLLGEQLSRIAGQVTATTARLLRLRLGGLRPVTVKAQRMRLADGTGVLLLVALDAPMPRRAIGIASTLPSPDAPPEAAAREPVTETSSIEDTAVEDMDLLRAEESRFQSHGTSEPDSDDESELVSEPGSLDEADAASELPDQPEAKSSPEEPPRFEPVSAAPSKEVPQVIEPEPLSNVDAPKTEQGAYPDGSDQRRADASPSSVSNRPLRFVWQTDESGVLTLVSPEFAEAVESDVDRLVGRSWVDIANELGFDPEDKLSRVLGRRDTWSGVTIDWPLTGGRQLPVDLAGLPVFDRDRVFQGFRGFGVCREPQAAPIADLKQDNGPEPELSVNVPEAVVVPFPEQRDPSRPPLSNNERQAFREIARALGASPADQPAASHRLGFTRRASTVATSPTTKDPAQTRNKDVSRIPALVPPTPLETPRPSMPTVERSSQEALLDAVPFAVLVHRAGVPIYMNRAFIEMTGFESLDLLAGAGVDTLFEDHGVADPSGSRPRGVQLRRADGVCIPADGHLKQIVWNGDAATLLTFRVSEGEDAGVESLETARQVRELTAILDTATDGIVILDSGGRILSINRSAEALFGYESAELAGRSITLLLSTESHATALDYFEGLRANGVALLLNDGRHVTGVARRGGSIPLFMTLGRLDDDAGAKFCAVLRDITQFKKAEEELRASKNHAENTSAQKSDFLARVSHEIRTPLNAILGFAEVMIEERFGPVGNERYRDYLKDIHTSGQHVISLVNDLLDLSKIEAGRLDLSFTSLQLNDVVTTAVGLMQPQANTAKVIVRTSLAAKLPSVVADERSIRQIALNLLSNAIKFTPAGGQVIISTALTDLGQAVIRVRDTGIGMNDKDIQAALEPFRQIASANRGEGTGLGLPLTKALTEANRATFAIQSAAGSGTLVEVIFPPTRVLAE